MTALLLVVSYRAYKTNRTDDMEKLREMSMNNIVVLPIVLPLVAGMLLIIFQKLCCNGL